MAKVRTNIEIEDVYVEAIKSRYGVHTKTEAVDLALRHLAGQPMTREQADQVMTDWTAAVASTRATGTPPTKLPEGLSAILNPGNAKAVLEADAIDPLALAAKVPNGTPVLLTCSDSDVQAYCEAEQPLITALAHTALTVVPLKGVSHVLRDDPSDNVANYANKAPLSPQLVSALDGFVGR